jgi:hypothetical protein
MTRRNLIPSVHEWVKQDTLLVRTSCRPEGFRIREVGYSKRPYTRLRLSLAWRLKPIRRLLQEQYDARTRDR